MDKKFLLSIDRKKVEECVNFIVDNAQILGEISDILVNSQFEVLNSFTENPFNNEAEYNNRLKEVIINKIYNN